jgi:hypothetical protein
VILLRSQVRERQRQAGVAVITLRINAVGNNVTDHPIAHAFLIAFGEIGQDDLADGADHRLPVFGQTLQIFSYSSGAALHTINS